MRGARALGSLLYGFLAMLAGSRAEATTWVVPEPQALANSADAVVLATVEQVQSVARPDGSQIDTEITLVVHDGLKGAVAGDRIVLREVGGHVGSDQQWMFGSPEYRVGETALVHVKRDESGRLHTHQMALGKLDAEVESNGRVWLRRESRGRGTERLSLDSFVAGLPGGRERGTRGRPRGGMAALDRLTSAGEPLTGRAQAVREFRLMSPESRWFDGPLSVFGDLAADRTLGAAVSRRVEQAMVAAWDGQQGSALDVQLAGNRQGPGFVCNPGYVTVSWNDPAEQVGDPVSCGGGAIAVAGFCSSGSAYGGTGYQRITSGAVVVNDGWDSCWFWNEKNLEEVLTHELGHTVGLAHSWEAGMGSVNDSFITGATMYWMAHFDGRGARLADYDQGALAWLYPGGTAPAPTPAPTPSPRPTATPSPRPTAKPTPAPAPVQDADVDGVRDSDDNCPADYNSGQGDADDDGVGDVCDSCAALANAQSLGCGTLEGYTRVAVRKTGKVLLDVRMRLPGGLEMRSASEVGVVIESESATWVLAATDSALRINGAGTAARIGTARSGLSLHAAGGDSFALNLHSNDPAAKKLAGASSLVIDLNLGTQRAAARLNCRTTWPEGRQVTRCETD